MTSTPSIPLRALPAVGGRPLPCEGATRQHGSSAAAAAAPRARTSDMSNAMSQMRGLFTLEDRQSRPRESPLEGRSSRAAAVRDDETPAEAAASHGADTHPEGGIVGWSVVAGSTTIFFVVLGLVYSFGVMQSELLRRQYASSSTLGWVSSVTIVYYSLLAVPITALIRATSNKFVAFLGAICTGAGYIATSYTFDKPVAYLFVAQSIFGIGYSLSFWSSNSLAGQYFVRKRAMAVGIVYSGSGVGGAVFAIGLSRLITRVGLELGVRIYGFIALGLLIPASLTLRQRKEVPAAAFDMSYLKQTNFLLLLLATALMAFSLFIPPFFLPTYAVASGLSAETGAWLVAGYNLASAVGRILFGVCADGRIGPVTSLCMAMLLMSTSILAIWMTSHGLLAPLIVFLLVNGAASGALLSLQPPVMAALYGLSEMAVTMAMVSMSRAAGSALGPPIAGYLLDAFQDTASKAAGPSGNGDTRPFLAPLGVMGAISLVAALSLITLRWRLAGIDLKKRV